MKCFSTKSRQRDLLMCTRPLAVSVALVVSVVLADRSFAAAQETGGMGEVSTAQDLSAAVELAAIPSAMTFSNAQFGSAGVGLRNQKGGGIVLSGVKAPVKAAFIYWAVITQGAATTNEEKIQVQRLLPAPASSAVILTGTVVGTGATPCWDGDTITVMRATIPLNIATGNGSYQVTILPGATGATDGSDPWVKRVLPEFEGASIVIVGTGSATVSIFDSGLSGHTFHGNPGLTYMLMLPTSATGNLTLFDNIGADGQQGTSRTAVKGAADEKTTINSVVIAGPGSIYNDSDWNGEAGDPLPQLWDDTGHDITAATPNGTTTLNITIKNKGESLYDCLTPVANVVQVE